MPVIRRAPALPLDHQPDSENTSWPRKFLVFFGIGRHASWARKSLVSLLWNLAWGFIQFVVIIVMLFLVKLHLKSPYNPRVSEWDACDRPLGAWAVLWLIRVVLASSLAYWDYIRDRQLHFSNRSNTEHADDNQTQTSQGEQQGAAVDLLSLPYNHLHSRLSIFTSLWTLLWFVTGNILLFTSIDTCRYAAPRLWWLNFAFLLKLYLVVLEVVVFGFIFLIVKPILSIFWNIFLICIGRHPMQNPNMITPEIGKLSKSVVDRIPLVTYIPPPGDEKAASSKTTKRQMKFRILQNFSFLGSKSSKARTADGPKNDDENKDSWADNWETGQYPFVTLEGNRAACAICLSDFEAPPKRRKSSDDHGKGPALVGASTLKPSTVKPLVVKPSTAKPPTAKDSADKELNAVGERGAELLKLEDAGAGAQPLRLLGCSHVFHQTCIDPWLTEISGRCPVCQRQVAPSTQ